MINNNPSSLFAVPAILLLLLLLLSFSSSPSVIMAQPQTGGATTIPSPSPLTPSPPLTPEEQEQQNRLQNVIAATNQNLDEAEKQVGGVVYTPRWSNPVWVEPDSLSILFAYCLPGEFAESGQEILGGFELEVLESYEIALAQGFMAWMMVIGNEDRQDRLPAAVGVICASDLNQAEARVLSPQEQQQINNVVQQFITTQVTDIDQVINIINNVTTNATTGGPVIPPSPTNDTGGTPPPPGGGGLPEPQVPGGIPENATITADTTPPILVIGVGPPSTPLPTPYTIETNDPQGLVRYHVVQAYDDVDGGAVLDPDNNLIQMDDVGGDITISCDTPATFLYPVGNTRVQCTAVDQAGNVGTASFTVTVEFSPFSPPGALVGNTTAAPAIEEPPAEEEQLPPTDEGAAAPVEEETATEEGGAAPANEGGG